MEAQPRMDKRTTAATGLRPRRRLLRWGLSSGSLRKAVLAGCAAALTAASASAQTPPVNYLPPNPAPPGAVGAMTLFRKLPIYGYFQPVQFQGPEGLQVAVAAGGQFQPLEACPTKVALQVAPVYRLRVAGIPLHPGVEIYPTVELISRTFPPPGLEWKFPVPIEITLEDVQLALEGKFVTRVVYIEDPELAHPRRDDPRQQRWFEVKPGENPIQVADGLGRPIAILRMGGRTPDADEFNDPRFYGSGAPIYRLRKVEGAEGETNEVDAVGAGQPSASAPSMAPPTAYLPGAGLPAQQPFAPQPAGPALFPGAAPAVGGPSMRPNVGRLPQNPEPIYR